MNLKETFIKVRAKIENPANWLQKYYAKDKNDIEVNVDSLKACKFCLSGAIMNVNGFNSCHEIFEKIHKESGELAYVYNDSHTHKEVINLLDTIISKL